MGKCLAWNFERRVKPNQATPNQNRTRTNYTKPNHTKPYHTIPYQTKLVKNKVKYGAEHQSSGLGHLKKPASGERVEETPFGS